MAATLGLLADRQRGSAVSLPLGGGHRLAPERRGTNALVDMLARERQDWRSEIKSVVDTAQNSFEAELDTNFSALEQRVAQHTDQRITQHIEQCTERTHALSDVIVAERTDRQKEVKAAVEEAQRTVEAMLAASEQRIVAIASPRAGCVPKPCSTC